MGNLLRILLLYAINYLRSIDSILFSCCVYLTFCSFNSVLAVANTHVCFIFHFLYSAALRSERNICGISGHFFCISADIQIFEKGKGFL